MKLSKYTTIQALDDENYLMVNALSGAVDVIDKENKMVIEQIKSGNYTKNVEKNDLLDTVRERGYLFTSESEEEQYIKRVYELYLKVINTKAAKIVICPTFSCNLRCVYCFESLDIRKSKEVMKKEDIDHIFRHIDTIVKDRQLEGYEIELFGGEPLLPVTYEANRRVFEIARERNKYVSIITNGTHIKDYENILSEYRDCISQLQITIDGVREIHDKRRIKIDKTGTFKTICEGINWLLAHKIKVAVRVNLDRDNIDTLADLVKFFEESGWTDSKYFMTDVAPVVDHTSANIDSSIMKENEIIKRVQKMFPYTEENSYFNLRLFRVLNHINNVIMGDEEMLTIPSFHYCEGNRMEFYVFAPDGKIYLCPEAVGYEAAIIGEYGEHINLYQSKSDWLQRNILTVEKCSKCEIAPFCGGGCPFASISVKHDINDPVCDDAKEVFSDYIDSIKDTILEKCSD